MRVTYYTNLSTRRFGDGRGRPTPYHPDHLLTVVATLESWTAWDSDALRDAAFCFTSRGPNAADLARAEAPDITAGDVVALQDEGAEVRWYALTVYRFNRIAAPTRIIPRESLTVPALRALLERTGALK
jgi:hypothetical protein